MSNIIAIFRLGYGYKNCLRRIVVVAHLAERLLLKPEASGSNQAISNFYKQHLFTFIC